MASKTPFTFTGVSHVIDQSGDGSDRRRDEIVFEQVPSLKGAYQFKPTNRNILMTEEELLVCDKTMMGHAGEVLSAEFASRTGGGQGQE